jgi:hypothetical protein
MSVPNETAQQSHKSFRTPILYAYELEQEALEGDRRRRAWVSARLWYNGPHVVCCKRCTQAWYVLALVRADRLDLLSEFPELFGVYEELRADGMLQQTRPSDHGFSQRETRLGGGPLKTVGVILAVSGVLVLAISLLWGRYAA